MGRPLHEYLGWPGPVTHRQHRTHLAWLRREALTPDLHDLHLAQLTAWVARAPAAVWGKDAGVQPADFLLPHETDGEGKTTDTPATRPRYTVNGKPYVVPPELTQKWRVQLARAKWHQQPGGAGPYGEPRKGPGKGKG